MWQLLSGEAGLSFAPRVPLGPSVHRMWAGCQEFPTYHGSRMKLEIEAAVMTQSTNPRQILHLHLPLGSHGEEPAFGNIYGECSAAERHGGSFQVALLFRSLKLCLESSLFLKQVAGYAPCFWVPCRVRVVWGGPRQAVRVQGGVCGVLHPCAYS